MDSAVLAKRRAPVRLDKQIDKQSFNRLRV